MAGLVVNGTSVPILILNVNWVFSATESAFRQSSSVIRLKKGEINELKKKTARIPGILYWLIGIFGGFTEGYVDPGNYVAPNSAAMAGNIVANSGLFRMGVVAHLLDRTFFVNTATVDR